MTHDFTKGDQPPASVTEGAAESEPPPRLCADVLIEDERWQSVEGFSALIPSLAGNTLLAAGLSPDTHALSIALLSDAEVHALNKAFRGKDAATNVLSFPSAPVRNQPGPVFLGDVALAYETVASEAADLGKPVVHHAAHLVVHGILHLAGFDHGTGDEAERMENAERLILGKFGIPDPYAGNSLETAH